ncbi:MULTISPECIES: hypothetical protein [Streptomycetaceae]|uniref:hypothetical protein n=1 Tax=Streptomycetaceae TaxID=2062 RepID=UPI000939C33E|nr:hypothetical protein [Streptomyces sp. CB02056]OKH97558.1 hypothetical protein AMK13_38320 [Streptomyces sp. CB02056]
MTAAVPFSSRPHQPGTEPGDAVRAPRELMTLPGLHHDVRRWHLVEVRLGGGWRPALLSVWRRPPAGTGWVAHVRWGPDGPGPGKEEWAWLLFDEATIRPLSEPAAPVLPKDAVTVPSEMIGAPAADDSGRCWRLAWIRVDGRWRSGVVTERRRPAPDLPWIVHARWGEDRQAAWVVADPATVRPIPDEARDASPGEAVVPEPAAQPSSAGADR